MGTVRYEVINGQVIAEKRNNVRRLYVPNPLGSTVALMDSTQTKTDTFSYWPYGEQMSRTGTTGSPFQYVGTLGYYQDNAARTYVRRRMFKKDQGRWLNQDPIGLQGGSANFFDYSRNNPITVSDPSGLVPWWCTAFCVAGNVCAIDILLACRDCGTDAGCWARCIRDIINNLPLPLKLACGIAMAGCLYCLTHRPPDDGSGGGSDGGSGCGCTPAEQTALQNAVNAACKVGKRACNPTQDCATLKANATKNSACAAARIAINSKCFGSGDPGHRQAAKEALKAVATCAAIMKAKGCI